MKQVESASYLHFRATIRASTIPPFGLALRVWSSLKCASDVIQESRTIGSQIQCFACHSVQIRSGVLCKLRESLPEGRESW